MREYYVVAFWSAPAVLDRVELHKEVCPESNLHVSALSGPYTKEEGEKVLASDVFKKTVASFTP